MTVQSTSTDTGPLLPCPFCGNDAPKCNGRPGGIMGQVYCDNEDCFGPKTTALTVKDSVAQWNARASGAAQQPVDSGNLATGERQNEETDSAYSEPTLGGDKGEAVAYLHQYEGRRDLSFEVAVNDLWTSEPLYAAPQPASNAGGEPDFEAAAHALGFTRLDTGTWVHPQDDPHFPRRFKSAEAIFDEQVRGIAYAAKEPEMVALARRIKDAKGIQIWEEVYDAHDLHFAYRPSKHTLTDDEREMLDRALSLPSTSLGSAAK